MGIEIRRRFVQWRIRSILKHLIVRRFREGNLYFENAEDAMKWGNNAFRLWLYQMNEYRGHEFLIKSEKHLKTPYQAIKWYCGRAYERVNEYLRFGKIDGLENISLEIISYLDEQFKLFPIPNGIIVVRWIRRRLFTNVYAEVKKGSEIIDKGYMSTSLHLFYDSGLEHGSLDVENYVLLVIKVPPYNQALFVCPISETYKEQEILLPRNTRLKVEDIYKIGFERKVFLCTCM
jgi:hypothetical protein